MELHYVHGKLLDQNDPVFRKINEFCVRRSIRVHIRAYNPYEHEEDKEFIARLPALQLYKQKEYQETLYPDFKPIQLLTLEVDKFELEELERESKKQIWQERLKYLRYVFRSSKTDFNSSNR